MKKILTIVAIVVLVLALFINRAVTSTQKNINPWKFQSIDTMKYSRDLSREKLNDPSFDITIDQQMKAIADTGATHVAIATPYDDEFYPILERWVGAARRYHLKVWFRGNWSGWEGWFDYPKITRAAHIQKTKEFIEKHPDLFEDGDVFTACPECENGGPGDPRRTGDVAGHRKFLIDEYSVTRTAFKNINKDLASNYDSMNGDEAKVIMDKNTTRALDGIVTIDHYVSTPEKFASDIKSIAANSGGKIVLGEFGAPIPDLNGNMTEKQQADFTESILNRLIQAPEVVGVNYWTNVGGSTALWNDNGSPKEVVGVLKSFYSAPMVPLSVVDETGSKVKNVAVSLGTYKFQASSGGDISIPYFENFNNITISAAGFYPQEEELSIGQNKIVVLVKKNESLIYKIRKAINSLF